VAELTLADIEQQILAMRGELATAIREQRDARAQYEASTEIIIALMAQLGDPTHLPKKDAARVLSRVLGRDVSLRTVERMIERKELVLEQIPGTKRYGIRIDSLYRGWTPVTALRAARRRGHEESDGQA